jgi:hypothetical protein
MAPAAGNTAEERRLPNLFLLGNPKSGSTFLFSCLRAGPFDPNLLLGQSATHWREGRYLLTTLGTKKEFNFWGGPSWDYGLSWYAGAPVPLSAWEWPEESSASGGQQRVRRGENGNGDPSAFVSRVCRLNSTERIALSSKRKLARAACRRFPLECFGGTPIVRPGCALVRPFPSARGCGHASQPPCETPRVRMSHAWPPAAETSPQALALDPSIQTFLGYPTAPVQLRTHSASPSALRFIVILREPISRAQSSARMMREWKWEKASNLSDALLADLDALGRCCRAVSPTSRAGLSHDGESGMEAAGSVWIRAAAELARLSDRGLRRFRTCLAAKAPLNHVRASVYAAGALGWFSEGFTPSQFLWLDTDTVRAMRAAELLRAIGTFAGLPTDHLDRLPLGIRTACESVRGERSSSDSRMHSHTYKALPPPIAMALQNAFRPFNELLRTLLAGSASLRSIRWL